MRKIIIIINILILISISSFECYGSERKVYVDGKELEGDVIIENEDGEFISINDIIEAIGGTVVFDEDEERVYITYDGIEYVCRQRTYTYGERIEEDKDDKYLTHLIFKVNNNPECKPAMEGEIRLSQMPFSGTDFSVYIYEGRPYFSLSIGNMEGMLNVFDYLYTEEENGEINVYIFDLTSDFFEKNLKLGMTMEEVGEILPYKLHDDVRHNNLYTFEWEYYLKNNSIVRLTYVNENYEDINSVYKLTGISLLTSDGQFVEKIL